MYDQMDQHIEKMQRNRLPRLKKDLQNKEIKKWITLLKLYHTEMGYLNT
jgi:hypothetical protein